MQLQRNIPDLVEEKCALVRQFKPADLLRDGPREGAPFVSEQFAFEQARGDGGAIHLDKSPLPPGAEVVNRSRDHLLAGACLTLDQHGRIRGCHCLHLSQDALQGGALSHDLFEVMLGADLFLEIELLFRQLLLELGDLSKGPRIVHGNCHLVGYLDQQVNVLLRKGVSALAAHIERSQHPIAVDEGHKARDLQAFGDVPARHFGVACGFALQGLKHQRLARDNRPAGQRAFHTFTHFLLDDALAFWKIQGVQREAVLLLIEQRQADVVVTHHPAKRGGNSGKKLALLEIRNNGVVDLQKHSPPVALMLELPVGFLSILVVQRVVNGSGHLASHQQHELHVIFVVCSCLAAAEPHGSYPAVRRGERQHAD